MDRIKYPGSIAQDNLAPGFFTLTSLIRFLYICLKIFIYISYPYPSLLLNYSNIIIYKHILYHPQNYSQPIQAHLFTYLLKFRNLFKKKIIFYNTIQKIMMKYFLTILFATSVVCDCPIVPYPRSTYQGTLTVAINNNPNMHNSPQDYVYPLTQQLQAGAVSTVVGVAGIEFNPHGIIYFSIDYIPQTITNSLKFKVEVNDPVNGWKSLRFNFIATQSALFQTQTRQTSQFSSGLSENKYSIYRPISNFNQFKSDPVIVTFISGLNVKGKLLGTQYIQILSQYENFRKFSTNTQLINYFNQAVEEKKSLYLKVISSKLLGRILTVSIESNCELNSIQISYLLFNKAQLNSKHSFIQGQFQLLNGKQYTFTPLQNMEMLIYGINKFKTTRDQLYSLDLAFNNNFRQASFNAITNVPFFMIGYNFIAFQMKFQFVCLDCIKSQLIFENRYCVQQCPRGYSEVQRLGSKFCDFCSMDQLKVVDSFTNNCVCANRHYLDAALNACKACRYDCMTCSNNQQCLTCDNNLLLTKRKLSTNGKCECPQVGFYDDKASENIVCQKCSPKCLTCDGPRDFDCLTCSQNKERDFRGFCVCRNGFVEDNIGNCLCLPPRQLNNNVCIDNSGCGVNQVEQFVDLTRKCVCKQGFQQVLNKCIKCGSNSIFNQQDLNCKCINNTVKVNDSCVACTGNTIYDQFTGICVCRPGSFKSNDGSCILCPPRMAYINGNCQCIFNYFEISPNVCQRCLRETDGPKCTQRLY